MVATIRYNTAKQIWQVQAGSLWFPLMHEERAEWAADGNAIDEAARLAGCEPGEVIQRGDWDGGTYFDGHIDRAALAIPED